MSHSHIVAAPLLVALTTAILTLLARPSDKLQRGVSIAGAVGYVVVVAVLFQEVMLPFGSGPETLVYQVSNWAPPFGIVLVADGLSAFMLGLAAVVSVAAVVFSVLFVDSFGQRLSYHPLYHFMMVGVSGSFLTGDVFNLFVWFEVMLMSSYILVLFYSGPEHTRAALQYVVLNLLGSAVMLLAIGGIYATTGTLNMADIARRLADPGTFGVSVLPVLGLSAILFSVFALKAGVVPFQFWVPDAYRAAPAPITAMLAGVVKKVGVYAILRLYFTIFAAATLPAGLGLPGLSGDSFLDFYGPIFFVMATASILLGGVGAVSRNEIDGVLAYSSIGQVGFILLPLAVGATVPAVRTLAVAASLVYAFNHGLAKSLLFLASGTVHTAVGTTDFRNLGGVAGRAPFLASAFLVGALALIGVPPLSGFFGKFLVFDAAARAMATDAVGAAAVLAVALVGAILTIAYFTRAWNAVFWGVRTQTVEEMLPSMWAVAPRHPPAGSGTEEGGEGTGTAHSDGGGKDAEATDPVGLPGPSAGGDELRRLVLTGEVFVIVSLALALVGFGVGFESLFQAAQAAAQATVDTGAYVDAVRPRGVVG
jgi:multicomponent Na+:H+ antiporter subunit D